MTKPLRRPSPANRQAMQEQSQAAAMNELKVHAALQRDKSNRLRTLRLESEKSDGSRFKT